MTPLAGRASSSQRNETMDLLTLTLFILVLGILFILALVALKVFNIGQVVKRIDTRVTAIKLAYRRGRTRKREW